jgi:hypothetical protein
MPDRIDAEMPRRRAKKEAVRAVQEFDLDVYA